MKPQRPPEPHSAIEAVRLAWLAAFVSVFSFLFYQRHGYILLYGDAVAHINIARRVFDSQTPGLLQLGTVWLPLPHLLILPFIVPMRLWQSGTGGSIPSMAAYILGVLGIFRLMRTILVSRWQSRRSRENSVVGRSYFVRRKPQPDLHANNRHGRVVISSILHLVGSVLCGTGHLPGKTNICDQMRPLSCRRLFNTV